MDISSALVANGQTAEAIQPRERALDDPAMAAQVRARVDPAPGDAGDDVPAAAGHPALGEVVPLVGMELGGTHAALTRGLLDRRDRVDQGLEQHAILAIRPTQEGCERDPGAVDHKMALRARFAPIRRVRSDLLTPFFAGILALSSATRLQSI